MLRLFVGLAATLIVSISSASADDHGHRQLGAHVHGQGTLDIAIEANKIAMELVAPGMDIVGFEHVATTDAQKEAVEKAKAKLADVAAIFKFPAAAACKVDTVAVENRKETHHPGDEDDDDKPGAPQHAEFHATYALVCASPAQLTGFQTSYFSSFAGTQGLTVNVTTEKGQTQAHITRDNPAIDLKSVM